ncbi:MAG: flippase-like domain-containing protein [Bryobacterales bacterium]|nr:flippase-like domain-containing protein [Bryobacterales bacterium]
MIPNRRWLLPLLGYAVSIACMVYVYRGFNWAEQLPRIRQTPLPYVLAAVLCDIAVYCVQGWRWNELLIPVGKLPVWRSMQAIYIGLFANEVLPLRPGEVIRSFLQARWSGVPFAVVLSSVVIERLFDGFWLILGFLVTSFFVDLPPVLVYGSRILAGILLILGALLAFAIFRRQQAEKWLNPKLRHHLNALESMGRSRSFYNAFLISFLYLALQVGPIYFIQQGFGLHLGFGASAAILVILRIGSVPPQAPGNVGSFQAFAILGAMLFGVDRQSATGYATLLFIVITVPLWVVGFFALLATKMKLRQLTEDAHQ